MKGGTMRTEADNYFTGCLYALEAMEYTIHSGDATTLLSTMEECKKKTAELERGFLDALKTVVKMDVNTIMKQILLYKFMLEYVIQNPGKKLNEATGRKLGAYMLDRVKATVAATA
jgi:hypothetical protein